MTALLDRSPGPGQATPTRRTPIPRPGRVLDAVAAEPTQIVVMGDFNCPWSYLAFRRAAYLSAAGADIDWRAVEHAPWPVDGRDHSASGFEELAEEMDRVTALLLPGERLPYDLAGFVPRTSGTVAAYAEAYVAQVAAPVRRVLFESFWMHGIDIGDPAVLRTLIVDELRSGSSPSEPVREWGLAVDRAGGPISSPAWRLVRKWRAEWLWGPTPVVPQVHMPGAAPMLGVEAVEWLGDQIAVRGVDLELPTYAVEPPPACGELPSPGWVSENGTRWLRHCQRRTALGRRQAG